LCFAALSLLGVLLSAPANRTGLSTAAQFLVNGFAHVDGGIGMVHVDRDSPRAGSLAEPALFAVSERYLPLSAAD
jgi:hypothetical protein